MTSIFRTVLGTDFDRLHPQLQRRFSVSLASGEACIGTGTMDRIWHARWATPFLTIGRTRHVLVPRRGQNVPFTIENAPYLDTFGRETVSFVRTFHYPDGPQRFDAQMVLARNGRHIVDYLGTHQHLASDLDFAVSADGSLCIRSTGHRFREGPVDVDVPACLAGAATVRESYDDAADRFRIEVSVEHPWLGPIITYRGTFSAQYVPAAAAAGRVGLRPVREECRM